MISVCLFNNKGGVGKTTLSCNIAAHLAQKYKKRVLLVDCDPQCNATQLLLDESIITKFYRSKDTRNTGTILDVLRPLQVGEPTIGKDIHPQLAKANRFGIDVIPGHPRLSILEDVLSESWGECTSGKIGGIRKTNWCSALHKSLDKDYDVAFFDIGPSLGSLNRSVLLGVQHFMSPVGADLFSVFGIRNIAEWLRQWLRAYSTGLKLAEDISPGVLDEYSVLAEPLIRKGFAGYTIQQYITKSTGGVRRATQAYERILRGIPNEVETSLGRFFATVVNSQNVHLGDVPHMYSLVPLAQSANAPIRALTSADGLAGSQFKQAEKYRDDLDLIVKSLAANIELPIGK